MKQYIPLVIGIALPVILILVIIGVIFIPRALGPKPQYSFVYSLQYSYYPATTTEKFMLYDAGKDSSREISIAEKQTLNLSTETRSPDGFTLEFRYNNAGIFELFGGGNNNQGWVLRSNYGDTPISIATNQGYNYPGAIRFIGWVINSK